MSHILIPAVSALTNAMFSKQNSHPGLRQQVIAVQIKNLSKEINSLVSSYDKSLEQIAHTRKTLSKSRKTSVAQIARLKATLHRQERRVLSSQIPLKIAQMKALLKQLNEQILDEE